MLFANAAKLDLFELILLAVAIVAFIVWLAAGTRDPDVGDVLKWVGAGAFGVVLIWFFGSWHKIAIDPATRRVTERHGYLGYELHWMGQQRGFQDFTTVVVERTTSKQSTGSKKLATHHVYRLQLRGAGVDVWLPMATNDDILALEAAARQVAQLGNWEAKRRGYVLDSGGDAAPQPSAAGIRIIAGDAESLIEAR